MKTNKYLFFNNYNQLDSWFRKTLNYFMDHKITWKYDGAQRSINLGNQKWIFVKNNR